MPSPSSTAAACCICCCFILIPGFVCFALSFAKLEPTEYGLDYNHITQVVDSRVYMSGLHFLGLGHSFIKYPKTLITIDFFEEDHSRLFSFTSDGLPVVLEASFQFALRPNELLDLYMAFKQDYLTVLRDVGRHVIAEVSTAYTAYDFFKDQGPISQAMMEHLKETFADLHCDIDYFQLKNVDLPHGFEDAIQHTIVAEQGVLRAKYKLNTAKVKADTLVLEAEYGANMTVIKARAEASKMLTIANANADATARLLVAEGSGYGEIKKELGLESADALNHFVWLDTVNQADNMEFFINMPGVLQTQGVDGSAN